MAREGKGMELAPRQAMAQEWEEAEAREELADDGSKAGVEQEINDEEFPFNPEKISISTVVMPFVRVLERLTDKGTISVPKIQRSENLWGIPQQSRLMESLMLRIPLPMFYVAADGDENWAVVDGLQRISAMRNFINGNPDKNGDRFKLEGLEFLTDFNGKTYDELPQKYKNRIMDSNFQFAVISPDTPPAVQRNIFKRLNTGGLPLSQQEIRHALYYDEAVAEFLEKLVKSDSFTEATAKTVNDSRLAAQELVLRFLAFLVRGQEGYPKNGDMDSFLSDTMLLLATLPDLDRKRLKKLFGNRDDAQIDLLADVRYHDLSEMEEKFTLAMERAKELFGRKAFRKSVDRETKRSPINKALFETVGITLAELDDRTFQKLLKNRKELIKELSEALKGDLGIAISRDSHKPPAIKQRFDYFRNIFRKFGGDQ